jgi:hypothetical protein
MALMHSSADESTVESRGQAAYVSMVDLMNANAAVSTLIQPHHSQPQHRRTWHHQSEMSPFSDLPSDVIQVVMKLLCPLELMNFGGACRCWHALAIKSPGEWRLRCDSLWSNKVCVPLSFRGEVPSPKTYFGSIKDSKRDVFESREELAAQHFHFRFKSAAGIFLLSTRGNIH